MGQVRMELRGWKAIAVLVAVLGSVGYRTYSRFLTVDETGRDELRAWLVRDYEGRGPSSLAQRIAEYHAGVPSKAEASLAPRQVEFVSLAAHGLPEIMVVRAEVTVDGGPPPNGHSIRYLTLTRKVEGGWMVLTETSSVRYYQALLR